jgi:transposase-like protein
VRGHSKEGTVDARAYCSVVGRYGRMLWHERLLVGPEQEDRRSQRERGMPTSEVARTFGVGASSLKRYASGAREGKPLAPKKREPGSEPKLGEAASKLLQADLEERPAATLPERVHERGEFLRAPWRAALAGTTQAQRFVFSRRSARRTSRFASAVGLLT